MKVGAHATPWLLAPELHARPWGSQFLAQRDGQSALDPIGEAWELSANSEVVDLRLRVKDLPKDVLGDATPLLIKILAPSQWLSVQVHPSDNLARARGLPNGKSECWFVLDRFGQGEIILNSTNPEQVIAALDQGADLEPFLERATVAPGDLIWIPSSAIHALGPGLLVLEVQQYSDTTYRLFDWGRDRRIDSEDGAQALRESPSRAEIHRSMASQFSCPYFSIEVVSGDAKFNATAGWQYFFALDNQIEVNGRRLERWRSYLLPANSAVEFKGSGSAIRVVPSPS